MRLFPLGEKQLIVIMKLKNRSKQAQYKAIGKALAYVEHDLRHLALSTHEYLKMSKTMGCKVFDSYAQNSTSGAYRIFWRYRPDKNEITILAITAHP